MSRSAEKLSPDKGKGDPVPSQHCTYPNPATLEKMHPLCSLNLEMPLVCPSFAAGGHPASLGGDPAGSPWVSEAISCPFQEYGHVGLFGEGQICQRWCWVLLMKVDGLPKLKEMKRLQERFSSGFWTWLYLRGAQLPARWVAEHTQKSAVQILQCCTHRSGFRMGVLEGCTRGRKAPLDHRDLEASCCSLDPCRKLTCLGDTKLWGEDCLNECYAPALLLAHPSRLTPSALQAKEVPKELGRARMA